MKYITGLIAFGTPCNLDTCGKGDITKEQYLDPANMKLYESDESPFGDYGIECDKLIDYHYSMENYQENELYNVANHVRAYCDMLYLNKPSTCKWLFYDCLNTVKSRDAVFELLFSRLRHNVKFHDINEFLLDEFGNAWVSFIDSKLIAAEKGNDPELADLKGIRRMFDKAR